MKNGGMHGRVDARNAKGIQMTRDLRLGCLSMMGRKNAASMRSVEKAKVLDGDR